MDRSIVAFGAGVLAVGVPAAVLWYLRLLRIRRRAEAEAAARGRISRVDDQAVFRGTSGGSGPFGNGCLVLTDQELLFVQWLPHHTLRIARDAVVSVDRVHTHLGQATAAPLLRITWREASGQVVKTGWQVREPDEWARVLGGSAIPSPPTL